MEQPKFRGFSKELNTWVYGFGWYKTDYTEEFIRTLNQSTQDAVLFRDGQPVLCFLESMGQFTGIKDKHDKEAYSGDLFYWNGKLREIVYREDKGAYMAKKVSKLDSSYFYLKDIAGHFEILGNVTEHLNILNAKEGGK